jgi:hypothetical protein
MHFGFSGNEHLRFGKRSINVLDGFRKSLTSEASVQLTEPKDGRQVRATWA